MKLTITERSEQRVTECDYRSAVEIELISGEVTTELSFSDGEPEDSNLSRDFSDVHNISSLVVAAYNAGKAGEDLEVVLRDSDDI